MRSVCVGFRSVIISAVPAPPSTCHTPLIFPTRSFAQARLLAAEAAEPGDRSLTQRFAFSDAAPMNERLTATDSSSAYS